MQPLDVPPTNAPRIAASYRIQLPDIELSEWVRSAVCTWVMRVSHLCCLQRMNLLAISPELDLFFLAVGVFFTLNTISFKCFSII